jgi:O-acetyl-ADP-ribose deacetylase (regulator of RNase III)
MKLHLRDISPSLVTAWREAFADVEDVEISQGDIFSKKAGVIGPEDPIDIRADAVVSPANSFGFMDGGIDAVFTYQLGPQVQAVLQKKIVSEWAGELPVGQALIVPTGRPEIPFCISAPTMRSPSVVANTVNAYLALRAALIVALAHDQIRTILCPGLATAVGRMPPRRCARQMRAAWDRIIVGKKFEPRTVGQTESDDEWLLGD